MFEYSEFVKCCRLRPQTNKNMSSSQVPYKDLQEEKDDLPPYSVNDTHVVAVEHHGNYAATSGEHKPKWSWCVLITSVISTLCCCAVCGIPAMVAALASYTDHKVQDYNGSSKKRKLALRLAIAGIVIGAIFLIFFAVAYTTFIMHFLEMMKKTHNQDPMQDGFIRKSHWDHN